MPELQEAPENVLPEFTPEEIAAARGQANQLMAKDAEVSGAAQAMVIARRAYGVANLRLMKAVKNAKGSDAAAQAIGEAMRELASKPFNLGELTEQVTRILLPLMLAENADLTEADNKVEKEVRLKAEDIRRELPIGLGFRWNETDSYVPRNQSVIFAGNQAALRRAVNYILSRQEADGRTVLHLTNDPHVRQVVTNTRDKPLVQVALPQWRHVAGNQSQFQRFLANWMRFARGVKFDLVLVDDISKLVKPAFKGAPEFNTIPGAIKALRKACDFLGAGPIALLPREELVVTESEEEQRIWTMAREFAHVVPIHLLDALGTQAATHYRWTVGDDGAQDVILKDNMQVQSVGNDSLRGLGSETAGGAASGGEPPDVQGQGRAEPADGGGAEDRVAE